MPKPPRSSNPVPVRRFELDWTTASVRTILLWGGLVLSILLMGGYAYWQKHFGPDAPRSRAESAVEEAVTLLGRARDVGRTATFAERLSQAESALAEARESLAASSWASAEARALDSKAASSSILDEVRSRRREGPTAKFVKVVGQVEMKRKDAPSWMEAAPQMELDPGDLVRTKESSSAQIIFFDGVSLVLAAESLIEVQLRGVTRDGLNKNPNVHITVGVVDFSTPKFNVARTEPSMSTDNVEARLRNDTDLRVARLPATSETDLVVSGGGGADILTVKGEAASLNPNEGARVRGSGEGATAVKRKLLRSPLLILPADHKVYRGAVDEGVRLVWQTLSEARAYHVQISDSSLWARTILDRKDITGDAALTVKGLPMGDFHWRVAAINAEGNASAFSMPRKFTLKELDPVVAGDDKTPPPLRLSKKMVFENIVIITGQTESDASVTVNDESVDVEPDGSFSHFMVLISDGANNINVIARDTAGNVTRKSLRVDVAVF